MELRRYQNWERERETDTQREREKLKAVQGVGVGGDTSFPYLSGLMRSEGKMNRMENQSNWRKIKNFDKEKK